MTVVSVSDLNLLMREVALLWVFPSCMVYAAVSDLLTMTIPNRLNAFLFLTFFLFWVCFGTSSVPDTFHLLAGGLLLVIGFFLFCMGWIGGGDAKFMAVVSLWLGQDLTLTYLLSSSLLGGFLALFLLYLRGIFLPPFLFRYPWVVRLMDRNAGIPYGLALAGAALFLYPSSIWMGYLLL